MALARGATAASPPPGSSVRSGAASLGRSQRCPGAGLSGESDVRAGRERVSDWTTRASRRRPASTDIILDPFLRHPAPPAARVRALAAELAPAGIALWLRLPTIVRPDERRHLDKWLHLDVPVLTGHLGLARELAATGRRVTADYAVNCFNQHTAAALFGMGVERIVLSVELTAERSRPCRRRARARALPLWCTDGPRE